MINLKNYLYLKRLTRKELAAQCGVSVPSLRLVEKGMPVSKRVADKVSATIGCSAIRLMRGGE